MKKPGVVLFPLLLACGQPAQKKDVVATGDTANHAQSMDTTRIQAPVFTYGKAQVYGDSLEKYFATWRGRQEYQLKIDTLQQEGYITYAFKYKNKDYRGQYYTEFEIFEFPGEAAATDFFNGLKTQELVQPFGLNKRPNHLLVNDRTVIWHHFEHGYGHRMEAIKNIFRWAFDFHPTAANLDSVSGFNYCKCVEDDANLDAIKGNWKHIAYADIFIPDSLLEYNRRMGEGELSREKDAVSLGISGDSLVFNQKKWKIEHKKSVALPSAADFIYTFFYDRQMHYYQDSSWITPAAAKMFRPLRRKDLQLTWYDLYLYNAPGDYDSIQLFLFGNGEMYAQYNNRIFRLKRTKKWNV